MADVIKRNNVNILPGGDQTIVYAHGFGCNQDMWADITPAFKDTYTQVLFDYVGSGNSDLSAWSKERYASLDGYADDLIDVCDALDLTEGVVVIAHSVSATIAMLASIKRPSLFSKLILIGPTPCFLNDPPAYKGGFDKPDLEGLLELMESNYMGWASYLAPVVSGEVETATTTAKLEESFCSTDPVAAKTFAQATFFADNRHDLPKVDTPCLILHHANDNLVPEEVGKYLQENLKHNTFKVMDVSGHCAHMSHPQIVIDAVKQYL